MSCYVYAEEQVFSPTGTVLKKITQSKEREASDIGKHRHGGKSKGWSEFGLRPVTQQGSRTSTPSMSAEEKLAIAKGHKDTADQAFKSGDIKAALGSYHLALTYLNGLDKSALKSISMVSPQATQRAEGDALKEKTEVDEILGKVYANMSACHIKNGNWKRAQETADKALSKDDQNFKAMFRRAKALGEQGYLGKCEKAFADLKSKNPDDAQVVDAELARFRAIDKEKQRVHTQKLKGFLNKAAANEKKNITTEETASTA